MRTIVIGDPHGCLEELKELLELCKYRPSVDEVVIAGDLVDRGPYSRGVVEYARISGFKAVLGNHDEKAIRHRRHELKKLQNPRYKNPMRVPAGRPEEWAKFSEEDWAYLNSLPLFIRLPKNWVVVHAGLHPWTPFDQQHPNELLRIRMVSPEGKMIPLDAEEPPGSFYWADQWMGPESVIYGHNDVLEPRITMNKFGVQTIGVDTGCCFGRTLTAALFDPDKLPFVETVSVAAKRVYAVRKNHGVGAYDPTQE